jgi:integrase
MAKRQVTPLSDTAIKNAKPKEKEYTLPDGNGLQLLIKTDGRKVWEIRYTIEGKAKKTTAGTYPETSLAKARLKRDELKAKVSDGIDPIKAKQAVKAKHEEEKQAIEALSEGQFHKMVYGWLSTLSNDEATTAKRKRAFERDIFPYLCEYDQNRVIKSSKYIGEITHGELLKIINKKEETAPETARRLLTDCNRLWLYAISHEHATFNIVSNISFKDALKKPVKSHYAKITDTKILGELLRAIDSYKGSMIVKAALRFVSLIPLRADNLCKLKWSQIDLEKAVITIPRSEMKVKDQNLPDYKVPLPHQAITILEDMKAFTGWGEWVFHGVSNFKVHLNKESGNKALRLMGFNDEVSGRKQTLHSFRGTFRSLSETHAKDHGVNFEVMERVLDHHEVKESVRAYTHKADYTEQMRPLLQWWADYLDEVKSKK